MSRGNAAEGAELWAERGPHGDRAALAAPPGWDECHGTGIAGTPHLLLSCISVDKRKAQLNLCAFKM